MTDEFKERIKAAIHDGQLVECSKEEYPQVRKLLHSLASQYIDKGDNVRATIALSEIKRLDKKYGFDF